MESSSLSNVFMYRSRKLRNMVARWWYRRRRLLSLLGVLGLLACASFLYSSYLAMLGDNRQAAQLLSISYIRQSLLQDPGSQCNIPDLPVNASVIMQHVKDVRPITCSKGGPDWALCEANECQVYRHIFETTKKVECTYQDILWVSDTKNSLGTEQVVHGMGKYYLQESDFVQVSCIGYERTTDYKKTWSGFLIGVRQNERIVERGSWKMKLDQALPYNVLMFGFDSLSRNTVIRKLPKTYQVLKEELGAHILEGYNIVGDGTPQALIPILTGNTELEMPDTRKRMRDSTYVSVYPFIWNLFRDHGYVTMFNEDTPRVGIFTYRLKGFETQPTDHYMRTFYLQIDPKINSWSRFCTGDKPRHKLMMDYNRQLYDVYKESPKFSFSFHGELSHNDYNQIQAADDDLEKWLRELKSSGILKNTILIMMSDHGNRFAEIRNSLQGKQEERLPFFSLVLPPDMNTLRPGSVENLKDNIRRLSTPFDIHATLLDILGLDTILPSQAEVKFPPRSQSLFKPISPNRTCGQAWIEPHWCVCLTWHPMSSSSPMAQRLGTHLVQAINKIVSPFKDRCAELTLHKVHWAQGLTPTTGLLGFKQSADNDGFQPDLSAKPTNVVNIYQIKIQAKPGDSLFEASLSHMVDTDTIIVKLSEISRINKYGQQARCIYDTQPQLRKYCYCTVD